MTLNFHLLYFYQSQRGQCSHFTQGCLGMEGEVLTQKKDPVIILHPKIMVSCVCPTQKYEVTILMERWSAWIYSRYSKYSIIRPTVYTDFEHPVRKKSENLYEKFSAFVIKCWVHYFCYFWKRYLFLPTLGATAPLAPLPSLIKSWNILWAPWLWNSCFSLNLFIIVWQKWKW